MTAKKELLIEIQNLTWWYSKSPTFIFDKFNFNLYKWDFCFVLWRSWVGKTTLVKFLTRQIQPPKKMIFFKKEDISRFSDSEVQKYRRQIWVVFQDYKLISWKTVRENIEYPLQMVWISQEKINNKVNDVLYNLWLMDKRDTMIPLLSWWEKQRVAIARALVTDPEFLIADEPTGNLDWESSKNIADILIEINKAWRTIIFITHDLQLMEYISNVHNIRLIEIEAEKY